MRQPEQDNLFSASSQKRTRRTWLAPDVKEVASARFWVAFLLRRSRRFRMAQALRDANRETLFRMFTIDEAG